jgi:hypothetical protein
MNALPCLFCINDSLVLLLFLLNYGCRYFGIFFCDCIGLCLFGSSFFVDLVLRVVDAFVDI